MNSSGSSQAMLWFKAQLPHVLAIVVFILVSVVFNNTALDSTRTLNQTDISGYQAISKEAKDFRLKNGHYPLWTESLFSGMPTYTFAIEGKYAITDAFNWLYHVLNLSWNEGQSGLKNPINYFYVACLCFYILTVGFGLNWWICLLSSIAFGYATFNPILVSAGHETELFCLAVMPGVIAGVLKILKGDYLWGLAMTIFFFSMQVVVQHLQIIFYTGLAIGLIFIVWLITHFREKQYRHLVVAGALTVFGLGLGFLNYAYMMLPLQEYAKETMRGGKSELTQADSRNKTKGGLDKDYAFSWSYGIGETLTLFVPGLQGGGKDGKMLTGSSKFSDRFSELGVPEDNALRMANSYAYWGDQPFTSGPVYLGAVVCFLFILGMVYVSSWHKWWILAVSVLGIVMAWGRHFSAFNYFLFDYLPLYNKFRAPAMALVLPQLGFALLAGLGLQEFISDKGTPAEKMAKWRKTLIGTGVLVAVSLIYYVMADYKSANDTQLREGFRSQLLTAQSRGQQPSAEMQQQATQISGELMAALQDDRRGILGGDLVRSIVFVLLAGGLLWVYQKYKWKPVYLVVAILVLSSTDILFEGQKYLNEDSYVEADVIMNDFGLSSADEKINADPQKPFRVFDQTGGDPFANGHASYAHSSIGGYSPAKLALYNDLIEHQLRKGNQKVYDMLNTKYIITRGQGAQAEDVAIPNPGAYGPCWLVSAIRYVATADDEMHALDSTDTRDTAIIRKSLSAAVLFPPVADSSARIKLTENANDVVRYSFQAKTNQFAVFSEIYYPYGWNAFIDGKTSPYCRVNYVLRGMSIPAGNHTIEFRFEPKTYAMGNKLSVATIIISVLLMIAGLWFRIKQSVQRREAAVKR